MNFYGIIKGFVFFVYTSDKEFYGYSNLSVFQFRAFINIPTSKEIKI